MKRVNFNMEPECARLLKTTCALLDISVSEYVYDACSEKFRQLCKEDDRILQVLKNENLSESCRAYLLRESLLEELS